MVLCDNLEGWDGLGGGERFKREGTCILMADSSCMADATQYCKAIILQ